MNQEFQTIIKSKRGTNIRCDVIASDEYGKPLVIMAHGFLADRHEGGRFTTVAKALAKKGISSIRMSFPGCPGSEEDFINYSVGNCLDDIESCYQYMKDEYKVDENRVGMIGYSMGGRLTSIFVKMHPEIKVIGLWAAASYTGVDGKDEYLGAKLQPMLEQANAVGYADYLNYFDQKHYRLSKKFFDDTYTYDPEDGLRTFRGHAIVCHGTADETVDPIISLRTINNLENAKEKQLVNIHKANHGFGLWDNHPEQSKELTSKTIDFFLRNL